MIIISWQHQHHRDLNWRIIFVRVINQYVDFWFPLIPRGIPLVSRGTPLKPRGIPLKSRGLPLKSGGLKLQKLGLPVSIVSPKLKNCHRNKNLKSEFLNSYIEKSYSWLFDFPLKLGGIPLKLGGIPLKTRVMPSLRLGVVYP